MQISKSQQQVEKNLQELIYKYELENRLTVAEIKDLVWNEQGSPMQAAHEFQENFINFFPVTDDLDKLNGIMQVAMDAWNYFPHQILNGRSPSEIAAGGK